MVLNETILKGVEAGKLFCYGAPSWVPSGLGRLFRDSSQWV
jgi:hypothetical protein